MFLCAAGVVAGRELLPTLGLPDELQAIALDEQNSTKAVTFVGAAAYRVALKYGFKQIPLGDEVVVAAAVGGSGLAIFHNWKRKKASPQQAARSSVREPDSSVRFSDAVSSPSSTVRTADSPDIPDDDPDKAGATAAFNRSLLFGGN